MGLIDYMILSERFQGIRCDCIRLTLVDALILIKSLVPIALIYLFGIKLLIAFSYPIFCALFLYFYLFRIYIEITFKGFGACLGLFKLFGCNHDAKLLNIPHTRLQFSEKNAEPATIQ